MLLLRSLSLYGTRSPQELLKASGLTQVRTQEQNRTGNSDAELSLTITHI